MNFNTVSDFILPAIFAVVLIFGIFKKRDVFDDFTDGVKDGFKTIAGIFPSIFALVICLGMLRASGFLDVVSDALKPLTNMLGFPSEVTPLVLMRPFSGSGATALFENILSTNHPDSFAGIVASVIIGSSETLFYTIAIYFAAAKIKKTRYTVPVALTGDLTVFLLAAFAARMFVH